MLEFKREVLFAQLKKALPFGLGNVNCTAVWIITKGGVSLHPRDFLLTEGKTEKWLGW